MDPVTASIAALGALGKIFGGNQDQASQLKWDQDLISTLLNIGSGAKDFGQSIFLSGKDDLYNRLLPFLDNTGAGAEQTRQNVTGLINDSYNLDSFYNPFRFLGQNLTNAGLNPLMQYAIDQQGQVGSQMRGMGEIGSAIFTQGGRTPESQAAFDMISRVMNNSGNPQMRNIAQQVIQGGGANPYSNFTVDAGTEAIKRGGMTPQAQELMRYGQLGLNTGGMTPWDQLALEAAKQGLATQGFNPNSIALSNAGQGLLATGGNTPENQFLRNRGQQILSKNPLLSMDEVVNMAADKAGMQFANNSLQNYRQAMLRGGGPAVRSGLQNQAVQETETDLLANVGKAINDARMAQQGLQLQEFGMGSGLMGAGLQDILSRINLGGNLTAQGENAALDRMRALTGLGSDSSNRALNAQQLFASLIGQSGQLANQNMATLGGLGMQGLKEANDKLGLGINLFGQTNNTDLNAINQYLNNLQGQNTYAINAGNVGNYGFSGANNAYGNVFANSLAGDKFGLERLLSQYDAFQKNLNTGMNFTNNQQQNFLTGLNPVNNYMNQGFNLYNQALSGMMGIRHQAPTMTNPYGTAVNAAIEAAGTMIPRGPRSNPNAGWGGNAAGNDY